MAVKLTSEMIQGALQAQEDYHIPASVTLAQIMLESGGNYKGGMSKLASESNNLFGIKAGSNWNGETVSMKTTEQSNGKNYTTTAKFRKYNSVSDSIIDHAKLLNSGTYTSKTAGSTNLNDYVSKMASVYATDRDYSKKLIDVINTYDLTRYDDGTYPEGATNNNDYKLLGINFEPMLSTIAKFIVILLLLVLGVVFFMSAFEIMPGGGNVKSLLEEAVA